MPEKILYYLGAGASVKALPLAKSIVNRTTGDVEVPGLAYELEHFDFQRFYQNGNSADVDKSNQEISKIKSEFIHLAQQANVFGDVDTYAKYLHLKNPGGQEFLKLKSTLSQYFALKQITLEAKDPRYLPWLVSIMNSRIFPKNIKVLSWNYDYQLEQAVSIFGQLENITYHATGFGYDPASFTSLPNLDPTFSDHSMLSLIHLNGVAGFSYNTVKQTGSIFQPTIPKHTQSVLSYLIDNDIASHLHFAWEGSNHHDQLLKHVEKMIEETTIVVVIGYSFPFFNRRVDKQVFDKLKSYHGFKRIYYQDPILNGEQLRAQFDLSQNFSIKHISTTDNFYIPFEY